ncbi:permease [Aliifodinibius salicampi]|uniref:Permease n=1 Tax=Fodinibius salicampi TaxID=1920655 RepID=A0ABT3PXG6_9BACT|nr:permease [Fodinibius salicampi]MCW9712553.1 permease [Fodinibius salicampi]
MQSLYSKAVRGIYAVPKQTWFGIGITLFLWWIFMHYTRWPAVQAKSEILTVLATGAPNTFTEIVSRDGWPYWLSWIPTGINMTDNNAIGMAFAFLIGGAITSLVLPQGLIRRLLNSKGTKGSTYGGLLGAPLMMCSACSVPVALGWKERGANPETTLGVVMGAALLNIMGLTTIFVLFPGPAAWGRIVASILLVVVLTPLVVKLAVYYRNSWKLISSSDYLEKKADSANLQSCTVLDGGQDNLGWTEAGLLALKNWWNSSVEIAYRLFLPMTGAMFLAAIIRLMLPPGVVETYLGSGFFAIIVVSAFGTMIAIPTLFEIPLVLGFLFIGMGLGPATALIVTAPSVSIVSYFMLKKDVGHAAPLLLMVATFLMGIATGLTVEYLMTYYG